MGAVNYLVKTGSYSRIEALKLFKKAVEKYNKAGNLKQKQEASDYFLNNCYQVGLCFEDH